MFESQVPESCSHDPVEVSERDRKLPTLRAARRDQRLAPNRRRSTEAPLIDYGPDAPALLRGWADELEAIASEVEIGLGRPCH